MANDMSLSKNNNGNDQVWSLLRAGMIAFICLYSLKLIYIWKYDPIEFYKIIEYVSVLYFTGYRKNLQYLFGITIGQAVLAIFAALTHNYDVVGYAVLMFTAYMWLLIYCERHNLPERK